MPFDIGLGTRLYVEVDTDTNIFTELPAVISIKLPAAKFKEIETPHLNQPTRVNPVQGGTGESGSLEVQLYYDYDVHVRFGTWAYAGDIKRYRGVLPNGRRLEFSGFLSSEPELDEIKTDDPVTMKIMIRLTGGTTLS